MVEREIAAVRTATRFSVVAFNSLLMDFAEREGASMIVRGLRAVADFEYEYQMAGMNQQLNDEIETVFLMADVSLQPIASRLVKEIALFGGNIDQFVTPSRRRGGARAGRGDRPQGRLRRSGAIALGIRAFLGNRGIRMSRLLLLCLGPSPGLFATEPRRRAAEPQDRRCAPRPSTAPPRAGASRRRTPGISICRPAAG